MGWQDRDYHRKGKRPDDDAEPSADCFPTPQDETFDEGEEHEADSDAPDPEAPDASDTASGDEPDFIRCPNCRKMIAEDAEQCPRCGHYVLDEEVGGRPIWIWVGLVLAMIIAAMWALH